MYYSSTPCACTHGALCRYADRPHLATWRFYERRVFATIAKNTRNTLEVCAWASRKDGEGAWRVWVYGERGSMAHDVHLVPMGVGSSYAAVTGNHSAIHAERGSSTYSSDSAFNVPTHFAHPPRRPS